jgi:hypothetical protein
VPPEAGRARSRSVCLSVEVAAKLPSLINDCSPWILNQDPDDDELDVDELIGLLQWRLDAANGLLIIDPLAEHFQGDENSSKDMGAFVRSLGKIRTALPGLDILVIHL